MKTLIYTMAFGDEHFFELAAQFVRRLRGPLCFQGDVLVLADRPWDIPGARVVNVTGREGYFRTRLPVTAADYERILCCDSDVWIRDLDTLLFPPHETDPSRHLVVGFEPIPLKDCAFNRIFHGPGDSTAGNVLNAGTFLVRGRDFAPIVEKWNAIGAEYGHKERNDQAALQLQVCRGEIRVHSFGALIQFPFKGEGVAQDFTAAAYHLNGIEHAREAIPQIMRMLDNAA